MSAPSMPSPDRVAHRSIELMVRKGYNRKIAAHTVMDVVEAIVGDGKDHSPWAKQWFRGIWKAACRIYTYAPQPQAHAPEAKNVGN